MAYEAEQSEVIAAYRAYVAAFLANDVATIDALVQYPPAYVAADKAVLLESLPVSPADLMAQKQWHTSTDMDFEVVGLSADKAHVILPRARRLRVDGSLI